MYLSIGLAPAPTRGLFGIGGWQLAGGCAPGSLAEISWGSEIIVTTTDLLQKSSVLKKHLPKVVKMKNGIMGHASFIFYSASVEFNSS